MNTRLHHALLPWRNPTLATAASEAVMLERLRSAGLRAQQACLGSMVSAAAPRSVFDALAHLDMRLAHLQSARSSAAGPTSPRFSGWRGATPRTRTRPLRLPAVRNSRMQVARLKPDPPSRPQVIAQGDLSHLSPDLWRAIQRAAQRRRQHPDAIISEALHNWLAADDEVSDVNLLHQPHRQHTWALIEQTLTQLRVG